jgi:hypothetical protein
LQRELRLASYLGSITKEVAMSERPVHNNLLPPSQKISTTPGALCQTSLAGVSLSETSGDQEPKVHTVVMANTANRNHNK